MSGVAYILTLIAGTFVSEDLTCITAGQLVAGGIVGAAPAVLGCFLGIYLSDLALWMVGRILGRRALDWKWLARRISARRFRELQRWMDEKAAMAIIAARFLPGTRLPMYVAAGAIGRRWGQFAFWSFAAAAVWTPILVLCVARFGDALVAPMRAYLGSGWAVLFAIALSAMAMRIAGVIASAADCRQLLATLARWQRYEFWPAWVFYAPVVPYIAWLAIRHGGLRTVTAANPGMPHGGIIGESKFAILRAIRSRHVCPTELVSQCADPAEIFDRIVDRNNWSYPLIIKPDVGQRGAGVRIVHRRVDALAAIAALDRDAIIQPFHPGPFEAGIFYYRFPGQAAGRILSITDKVFPEIIGDGGSTLEQLIWRHRRFRMQARTFLARHAAQRDRVLGAGERFRLAVAGNHCQGTLFRDGSHLITPALEAKIDQIARSFEGFYVGRFDIRYGSAAGLASGDDLTIIELNGVTSESTNLYDPSWSILRAYRQLFRQWRIIFEIGARNRERGSSISDSASFWRMLSDAVRSRGVNPLSD